MIPTPSAPYSMIVLDVDDTLYLEREYVRSGFAHVGSWAAEKFAIPDVGEVAWSLFEAGVRGTTLTEAFEARGVELSDALSDEIVHQYRTHFPKISLLADARRLVASATARHIRLGIVTDGPAVSQRNKCHALGCDSWAHSVVVTADMSTSKPDPLVFRAVARGTLGEPHRFIYVADNPAKDFQGPALLGWSSVRVRRPGSLHESADTPDGVEEMANLGPLIDRLRG